MFCPPVCNLQDILGLKLFKRFKGNITEICSVWPPEKKHKIKFWRFKCHLFYISEKKWPTDVWLREQYAVLLQHDSQLPLVFIMATAANSTNNLYPVNMYLFQGGIKCHVAIVRGRISSIPCLSRNQEIISSMLVETYYHYLEWNQHSKAAEGFTCFRNTIRNKAHSKGIEITNSSLRSLLVHQTRLNPFFPPLK